MVESLVSQESITTMAIKEIETQVIRLKEAEEHHGNGDNGALVDRFVEREHGLQQQIVGITQRAEMAENLAEANAFSAGIVERRRLAADAHITDQSDAIRQLRGALLLCIEDMGTPEQRRERFKEILSHVVI